MYSFKVFVDGEFAGRLARYLLAAHSLPRYATAVEAFLSSLHPREAGGS
jgi:hypothetical protein